MKLYKNVKSTSPTSIKKEMEELLENGKVQIISNEAFEKLTKLIDAKPAPSESLRELLSRPRRYKKEF